MNTITNKPFNDNALIDAIKSCYPNSLYIKDGPWLVLDLNEGVKYIIWLKKVNVFEVIPKKALWNRTFEMKAKAQEISERIKDFIDNDGVNTNHLSGSPIICQTCKNPNSKNTGVCEWCGSQIIL
jgi:hypothetical protein